MGIDELVQIVFRLWMSSYLLVFIAGIAIGLLL